MKKIYLICSLAVFLLITAGISFFLIRDASAKVPVNITLVNQNGETFNFGEDKKLKLVEFIYTNCPDICPTTTQKMVQLKNDLEKSNVFGKEIEFVTITIDPYRDTPGVLQKYMNAFEIPNSDNWIFLTGDPENIKADQKKIREVAESLQFQYKDPGNGQFVHTSFTYLIDENNKYISKFPMGEEFNKQEVYEEIMDEIK
ncbi:SCO family protein [Neobacillus sp. 179-C4.2 HS]|jgi:protein SCO1|uniref:SCO family protein n=1 Tax=Neobacillus driksii TaxID=3035913 RepID=A0ABV4YNB6_9BACI|nr:SCO family protein [Neobacillus sp. 179.-C4.2 HS]MDP5193656.1 SCO family protein [Neobacillus sp. 179.-C4.2 HS]